MKKLLITAYFLWSTFPVFSGQENVQYQKINGILSSFSRPVKLKKENNECFILLIGKNNAKNGTYEYCFNNEKKEFLEINNIPYDPFIFISEQEGEILVGADINGNWWASRINSNHEVIGNKKIKDFSIIFGIKKYKNDYLIMGLDSKENAKISIMNKYLQYKENWVMKDHEFKIESISSLDLTNDNLSFRINNSNALSNVLFFDKNLNFQYKNKLDSFSGESFKIKDKYFSAYYENNNVYIEQIFHKNEKEFKKKIKSFDKNLPNSSGLDFSNDFLYFYWIENSNFIFWKKMNIFSGEFSEEKSIQVDGTIDPELLFFHKDEKIWLRGLSKKNGNDYIFSISIEK
jgi:hypothetical protein